MSVDLKKDLDLSLWHLQQGHIILYPTDTIWGIGCDATDEFAISKIFELKHRSPHKSMIILVPNAEMVHEYTHNPSGKLLKEMTSAKAPTTGIFNHAKNLPSNLTNEDGSIAIRIASDDFCRELLMGFQKPIVSTSANISNKPSPQNFSEIDPELINLVDYTVFHQREDKSIKKPSHIIRLNEQGNVERIR